MNRTRATRALSRRLGAAVAALVVATGLAGCGDGSGEAADPSAQDTGGDAGEIVVSEVWVRATARTDDPSMSAAFMAIANETETEVTLESVDTDLTQAVELHEMAAVDGEMTMQEAEDGILVGAGKTQMLMPGGYHIMLMDLEGQPLRAGDEVELTLTFSDGTAVDVTAPVKRFTEEEGHYHAPDEDMDHEH